MGKTIPIVCVVDDDESVGKALRRLLRSVGLTVKTFGSAEDFLNSGTLGEPSCLILDVRMPGLSGLELQKQLTEADLPITIIFITAHEDPTARAQALAAGAVGFLQKPFDEDALLNAVSSALAHCQDGAAAS